MVPDANWLESAGRALILGFFIVTGLCNLTPYQIRGHIERMAEFGTPFASAAFWTGIVMQFTACVLILAGWHAAVGYCMLIVFTVTASAIFHRFWEMKDPMRSNFARLFFLQNCALVGGLLLLLGRLA